MAARVAGVEGQVFLRLENQAQSRRPEIVRSGQAHAVAAVQDVDLEVVVAQARHDLDLRRQLDLVLGIEGGDIGHAVIAGVRGIGRPGQRQIDRRVGQGRRDAGHAAGEVTRQAQVLGVLAAQLEPGQERVADRSGIDRIDQVGLGDEVLSLSGVVVGRDRHGGTGAVHRARKDVLVELVIVSQARAVAQHQAAAEVMLEEGVQGVHVGVGRAAARVAEEGRLIAFQRTGGVGQRAAGRCGNAPVGHAAVLEMFVAEAQQRRVADAERGAGIDPEALVVDAVAVAAGVLIEAQNAQGRTLRDLQPEIDRGAEMLLRTDFQMRLIGEAPAGLSGHAVQHAADAAAPEDHRVRAFQHLDALDVVDIAIVLGVVPQAVREEVRGRGVAPEDQGVAVAFALGEADARHITHDIGHALQGQIVDLVAGDDRDGLRRVDQRRVGPCRGGDNVGVVDWSHLAPDLDGIDLGFRNRLALVAERALQVVGKGGRSEGGGRNGAETDHAQRYRRAVAGRHGRPRLNLSGAISDPEKQSQA